jgi:pyruvate formate lyase activating enzyme
MMLPIKGLLKTSLIDYAPYTSCVVFIGGCNFRCGFCHNGDLVVGWETAPGMEEKEIFDFLDSRKGWIDAVVITGGEPTLYPEIIPFVRKIKEQGYMVKLDTNGSRPDILLELLPFLDYVAMDIKAPLADYDNVALCPVDKQKIQASVGLLMNGKTDYEFRTTVVPQYFDPEKARQIGTWLKGAKKYVLQQYRAKKTLDPAFSKDAYCKDSFADLKDIMSGFVQQVETKGI